MARKLFFIAVALIPVTCLVTVLWPAGGGDAGDQLQATAAAGSVAFYVIIALIVIAAGAALYDRFASRR